MGLRKGDVLIDHSNYKQYFQDFKIDGQRMGTGYVPRNFARQPEGEGLGVAGVQMPVIPRSEWSDRIKERERLKSQLSDYRRKALGGKPIPSLDQNGQGFCWAYSTGACMILLRLVMNQPYVRFSPHAVACKITGFVDEGAWGALSMEFAVKNGYPGDKFWPQKSMSRQYDTQATWENAAKHKVLEGYWDLDRKVYDRNLTFDQFYTMLLLNVPGVGDFNHMAHSMCMMDPVESEPGSFDVRVWNSWTDAWGNLGEGILRGELAIPDGGVVPRVTSASQD